MADSNNHNTGGYWTGENASQSQRVHGKRNPSSPRRRKRLPDAVDATVQAVKEHPVAAAAVAAGAAAAVAGAVYAATQAGRRQGTRVQEVI